MMFEMWIKTEIAGQIIKHVDKMFEIWT